MLATADVEILTTVEDVETGLALVVDAVKLRITAYIHVSDGVRDKTDSRCKNKFLQGLYACNCASSRQKSIGVYLETSRISIGLRGGELTQ